MSDNLLEFLRLRAQVISDRAYAIWEAEGRPEGRELEHWVQAELDVTAERAYGLWEAAGRPDGRDLDFWLSAHNSGNGQAPPV